MIVWKYWHCIRAIWKYRDYKPQPVSWRSFMNWLLQYDKTDQEYLLQLLKSVVYMTERDTLRILVDQNRALLRRLAADGVPAQKVVYMQVHDPGSSSGVILNMLRDAENLERRGCKFADSNDPIGLYELTNKLEEGAIIYVDDFAGTGNQFCSRRKMLAECIVGSFAEFFLVPAICEEAIHQLGSIGVEPVTGHIHAKAARPLHPNSVLLSANVSARLVQLAKEINSQWGLGYHGLATMVVLWRNAPNTVPLLLRGSRNQGPRKGLFPRFDDLSIPETVGR